MDAKELLKSVKIVLVIDWPSREVPELLAQAGFHVVVRGGPGPEDFSTYEMRNGKVVTRDVGRQPERADLVYSFRPFDELPGIIAAAERLKAKTVWTQSGLSAEGVRDPKGCWVPQAQLERARSLAQAAGLNYITEPYIGDAVREILSFPLSN